MHWPVNWNGIGFCQGISIVAGMNRRGIRVKWVAYGCMGPIHRCHRSWMTQIFIAFSTFDGWDERILIRIPQPIWSWPVRQVKALTFRDGRNGVSKRYIFIKVLFRYNCSFFVYLLDTIWVIRFPLIFHIRCIWFLSISTSQIYKFICIYSVRVQQTKPQTIMYNNYIIELLPEHKIAFVKAPKPNLRPQFLPLFSFPFSKKKKNYLMGFRCELWSGDAVGRNATP